MTIFIKDLKVILKKEMMQPMQLLNLRITPQNNCHGEVINLYNLKEEVNQSLQLEEENESIDKMIINLKICLN